MKENGVFIAHCPESNTNLSSGVVTIRQYLKEGIYVGLGVGGEFFAKVSKQDTKWMQ